MPNACVIGRMASWMHTCYTNNFVFTLTLRKIIKIKKLSEPASGKILLFETHISIN